MVRLKKNKSPKFKLKVKSSAILDQNVWLLKILNKNKNIPFFLLKTNNLNAINNSKEIMKIFIKIQKVQKKFISNYCTISVNNHLLNVQPLLNLRNQFFTKSINIIGSLCWPWYFDVKSKKSLIKEDQTYLEDLINRIKLSKSKQNNKKKYIRKYFFSKFISKKQNINIKNWMLENYLKF